MKNIFSILLLCSIVSFVHAQKTETNTNPQEGKLKLVFDNIVADQNLQLNTGIYTNARGEKYNISLFNYYISNISLIRTDGSLYVVPRDSSYFLIKEENPSQTIVLNHIPVGKYKGVQFTIGVDSLKNTAPIEERTGVLDPAAAGAGMYWSWNSGYIFLKMEGYADSATSRDKKFRYHIGGFGGYSTPMFNNIKVVHLESPVAETANVSVNQIKPPVIHLLADASKVLTGFLDISFAEKPTVMVSPYSVNFSANYVNMFRIDHIHND